MRIRYLLNCLKKDFYISFILLGVSALSLLFIPLVNINGTGAAKIFAYVIGAVFWIGLVVEQVFFWRANSARRKVENRIRRNGGQIIKGRIGLVSFFKNKEAFITDIVLFISAVATTIISILNFKLEWLLIISVVMLFVSFNLHCMLNGINYSYIKSYKKILNDKEQEKNEWI